MSQSWRHYRHARLVDFHDGDSCTVTVDHGFALEHTVAVRLYGISCPEIVGAERAMGLEALRAAREIAWESSSLEEDGADGPRCELWTQKASFGRYVGRVVLVDGLDFAREIIARGFGHAWDGKAERRPFAVFPLVLSASDEAAMYDGLIGRDFRP